MRFIITLVIIILFFSCTRKQEQIKISAIKNARESVQQFADDSGVKVGDIARANQGVFSITEKDPGSPEYKNICVVSTLRYGRYPKIQTPFLRNISILHAVFCCKL